MSIRSAATQFSRAINETQDPAVATIARGLKELAQALAQELEKIEREIQTVRSRVSR
jgi:hypothetical protein